MEHTCPYGAVQLDSPTQIYSDSAAKHSNTRPFGIQTIMTGLATKFAGNPAAEGTGYFFTQKLQISTLLFFYGGKSV